MNEYGQPQTILSPPQKIGKLSRVAKWLKDTASILGSITRILFTLIGLFFILSVFGALFGGTGGKELSQDVWFGDGPGQIAVINVSGTIFDQNQRDALGLTSMQYVTPRVMFDTLQEIKQSPNVKAVVLRINSPGGTVAASEEIYQMLLKFKQETQLPLYASFGEVAASGGYYIALAADYIIANANSLTGSIGVVMSTYNFSELAQNYGVKSVTVASGGNKSFLNPLEEVDPAQVAIVQSIIDEAYDQFTSRVRSSRDVSDATLDEYADGRILSGSQAQRLGFVDATGGFMDTIEIIRADIAAPNAQVVEYHFGSLLDSIWGAISKPLVNVSLFPDNIEASLQGKLAYMYIP